MNTATQRIRTIDLGDAQLMVFDGAHGQRVRVLWGSTLLTQEGEVGDALLSPGTELALHDGRTLLEALGPTRLQILGEARRGRPLLRALLRRARHWVTRQQFGPAAPELAI